MKRKFKKFGKILFFIFLLFFLAWIVLLVLFRPSHERAWELGQEKLPQIEIENRKIKIHNFRNFDWRYDGSVDPRYEERDFELEQLESTDVFISHFDDFEGLAHIFLSFGFSDGEQIVVSLETRREKGEEFSPYWGLLRQFEIIYVVGSEEDIVGLRTDIRNERLYLYQTIATPEQSQELFLKITEEVNEIYQTPKMYNTLTHNCTNELTRKVEDISDIDFPFTWKSILPGYFDEVLFEMALVEGEGSFSEVKERSLIDNEKVNRYQKNFREKLRAF